jgi:hypothetical protein
MSVRTWLIGVGWLLDVELSMVMMSPQSDKDFGIRPRNQSRNVALYKHFEKGAVFRYRLGLYPSTTLADLLTPLLVANPWR